MIRLALSGVGGRVGREVLGAALRDPGITLAGGLVRDGSALAGQDLGTLGGGGPLGLPIRPAGEAATVLAESDVLIDFTHPAATVEYVVAARGAGCAVVTGTTGLSAAQVDKLRESAATIPVLLAPNVSVGITALLKILPALARLLGADYDLEIVETHHRYKADAPSGTALALARALSEARGETLEDRATYGRQGQAKRQAGEIGLHAVRAGGAIGEHRIILASDGEQVEVLHRATSRQTYAQGALRAAHWIAGRPAGFYSMADVLNPAHTSGTGES